MSPPPMPVAPSCDCNQYGQPCPPVGSSQSQLLERMINQRARMVSCAIDNVSEKFHKLLGSLMESPNHQLAISQLEDRVKDLLKTYNENTSDIDEIFARDTEFTGIITAMYDAVDDLPTATAQKRLIDELRYAISEYFAIISKFPV